MGHKEGSSEEVLSLPQGVFKCNLPFKPVLLRKLVQTESNVTKLKTLFFKKIGYTNIRTDSCTMTLKRGGKFNFRCNSK